MNAKSTITYADYLRLKGLMVLASDHDRALKNIERSAAAIVGQNDEGHGDFGHVSDTIYNSRDAEEMLRKMSVTVEQPSEVT